MSRTTRKHPRRPTPKALTPAERIQALALALMTEAEQSGSGPAITETVKACALLEHFQRDDGTEAALVLAARAHARLLDVLIADLPTLGYVDPAYGALIFALHEYLTDHLGREWTRGEWP